jgi:DnaJ-class molecular chaperone
MILEYFVFGSRFTGGFFGQSGGARGERKGPMVKINIQVTLEELYQGTSIDVSVNSCKLV